MLIETILNDVCLDKRVKDGCFKIENPDHMDALREYLVKRGMDEVMAKEYCNKVVEGKYPERQAYNQNGILVTFPTPEYKARAIKKGTHFEQDPTAGQKAKNLFGGEQQPQQPTQQAPQQAPQQGQLNQPGAEGDQQEGEPSDLPVAGSSGGQSGGAAPTPQAPDSVVQGQGDSEKTLWVEPQQLSPEDPVPTPPKQEPAKTDPDTKAAEKAVIKQILEPEKDKMGNAQPPLYEQLVRLCIYADDSGYKEASSLIKEKLLR